MEGIVLQEESVENLVAVLLIDIATLEFTGLIFDTEAKSLLTMLIIYDLPLGYN